jgi:tetratricopeptide (TPR) repeat protein
MVVKSNHKFTFLLDEKMLPFFPEAVGKEGTTFCKAVGDRVRATFEKLSGTISTMAVSERSIEITWQESPKSKGFLDEIASVLSKGDYANGILLLEFFLSEEPENGDILYNLGMAYSDQNNLERAAELLRSLVNNNPDHINGRVALGVALLRAGKSEEAMGELVIAVRDEPENLWAQRNLGAGLMRMGKNTEAEEHLRKATEIDPNDQAAWFGYGHALDADGKGEEADKAYIKTIDLDEFSKIAELARQARSKLAHDSFRSVIPGMERPDAVMYCLGALKIFAGMTPDQVQKIGFEIAILGTRGIDVNVSTQKYTLRSMPGKFSGLHLLCYEYVAFKQVAPGKDIGIDLSVEYQAALTLFNGKYDEEK